MFPIGICLFFSWLDMWVLGRKTTEVECHCHHIIWRTHTHHQCDLSLLRLTLISWLRFLPCEVPWFPPFYTVLFGRKALHTAHILQSPCFRGGERCHHFLEGEVSTLVTWNSSEWVACFFFPIYLFTCLFHHILGFKPIPFLKFCFSRFSNLGRMQQLFASAPVSLWHTPIIVLLVLNTSSISFFFLIFKKFFIYFIYFWLRWVFVAVRGLPLVAGSGGLLFVAVSGLLIAVASLVAEHGL